MINAKEKSSTGMAVGSLIMGLLSLLTSFIMIFTPLFSGLAIAFSWLSRGNSKMKGAAIIGNILAVIAMIVSISVFCMLIAWIVGHLAGAGISGLNQMFDWMQPYIRQLLDSIGGLM